MGQQVSKKSKKGKDRDKDKDRDEDSTGNEAQQDNAADPTSNAASSSMALSNGSDPTLHDLNSSTNVSDPAGAPMAASSISSRTYGSPYPPRGAPPPDHSPQLSTTSPDASPKRSTVPLDIPTQTILSNGNAPNPSSVNSSGTGAPDSVGSTAVKDKFKSLDVEDMIQRLLDVGYTGKVSKSLCLKNSEITAICLAARDIFLSQPTLIELSPPVKIVGDVHGQYSDLIRLFEMCGFPPAANYLFLGDYVDRGKQSLETILLLLCYKIKYPENFFLLRGNHECANVTRGPCVFVYVTIMFSPNVISVWIL